jgi:hypothetical protein
MSHLDTHLDTQDDTGSPCYADRLEAGFLEFGPWKEEEGFLPVQWEDANPFECDVIGGSGECGCVVCPFFRDSSIWPN